MLAKPSSNLLQRTGGDHRGGRAQLGWRTFMMTCLWSVQWFSSVSAKISHVYFILTFCSILYMKNLHSHKNSIRKIYYIRSKGGIDITRKNKHEMIGLVHYFVCTNKISFPFHCFSVTLYNVCSVLELVTRLPVRSVTFLWQFSPGPENLSCFTSMHSALEALWLCCINLLLTLTSTQWRR